MKHKSPIDFECPHCKSQANVDCVTRGGNKAADWHGDRRVLAVRKIKIERPNFPKGGIIKILPVFLAAVLFLGGCVSNPLQVLSESLATEDRVEIIDVVRNHDYDRVQETSWTNFQTGNSYTMYPRWRNENHHIFALHAVVGGESTTNGGQLIQGYGHVFQSPQGLWTVSDQFSDIQMLTGQKKRPYRRNYFYLNVRKR